MIDRPIFTMVLVAFLLCFVHCQNKSYAQQDGSGRFHNDALGITFAKVGTVEKVDSSTYRITLQSSENSPAHSALAQVSATDRLFVDLPGSYGGRLFLDTPSASRLFHNRVLVDSVNTGQQIFRREYWTVYAGMGMWEGVINCSTREGGRYYIVSLVLEMPLGKPGEEINGTPLAAEDLKGKVLNSLQDTTNVIVNEFTTLLTSLQIHK
jgi:hypothetical protein